MGPGSKPTTKEMGPGSKPKTKEMGPGSEPTTCIQKERVFQQPNRHGRVLVFSRE
jgi:hypothetical protein